MEQKTQKSLNKNKFAKYICLSCGYIYDEELGDEKGGIKAGTLFKDLPENWICPDCGAGKDVFEQISFEDDFIVEDEE